MMGKEWQDLTRQDFVRLNAEMSGVEIGLMYGVHHNAVYYRLKAYGISTTKKRRRFDPPKAELESLYKSKSMREIADHYGVGETVVFMRCKEHGIGGISTSDRLSGKPKTLAHRLAMSRSTMRSGIRSGERNGNWKGGITSESRKARSSVAYHAWKAAVLGGANWRCQGCGKEHGAVCECCGSRVRLHAHHVVPFSIDEAKRYEVTNGKALCERCHFLEHR